MLTKINSLADSQTFTNTRLGITVTFDTHLEQQFLKACDLDHTIEDIRRVYPVGRKVERRRAGRVFPSFMVIRQGTTELVVLLNSNSLPRRSKQELDALHRSAATKQWGVNVWMPKDSTSSNPLRKMNKKRAGN